MTQAWMATGTEAWWARGSEHQSELLDFMSHRLSKASEAVRELGQCRSWEDASGVHSKWIEGTLADYSAQSTKVAAINVKHGATWSKEDSVVIRSKFRCEVLPVC